jgi:hypothetical protein
MSREGTIALSWPIAVNYKVDFELTKWHKRFFGVFLLLAAHVQGGVKNERQREREEFRELKFFSPSFLVNSVEKSIIMELSNLSADAGTLLKQTLREDLLFGMLPQ